MLYLKEIYYTTLVNAVHFNIEKKLSINWILKILNKKTFSKVAITQQSLCPIILVRSFIWLNILTGILMWTYDGLKFFIVGNFISVPEINDFLCHDSIQKCRRRFVDQQASGLPVSYVFISSWIYHLSY